MAAADQGKFFEFRDKIFGDQQKMDRDAYIRYAKELKLDVKKFTDAIDQKAGQPAIDADVAEMKALGIQGTPGFFVNGKFLSGAKPFNEFAKAINAELTKLNKPIPAGAQGV